jgi:Integrase core domain
VLRSFSRPCVSNDNPYSESLFRTVKYRPEYPNRPFACKAEACEWVAAFVDWYNHRHRQSVVNTISAKDESISDEFESLFTTFPHTTTWARMFVGNPVYVISQPMAYLFYGEQEWLSKWPAIMFTRCLDLATFFEQLGGDPVAVRYYKSLIMKDPSLHDLILANDAYTKHIFCLQKLISSNPDSKELLKNIGILLGREEIPLRSKISIVINLLRGGNPLKTLYRFMNSQDFREGSLAHYSLSIFSRGVRMVSSFRGYGRN